MKQEKYEEIKKFFLEIVISDILLPIKTSRNTSKRDQEDFLKRHESKIEELVKKTIEEENTTGIRYIHSLIKKNIKLEKEFPSFNSEAVNLLLKSLNKKILEKANISKNSHFKEDKIETPSAIFREQVKKTYCQDKSKAGN